MKNKDLNDLKIILIEEYNYNSKNELLKREDYHINLYKNELMNIRNAFLDTKEYYKKYYENNNKKYKRIL